MSYLQNTIKLAEYYRSLGEKTFDQLSDEELEWAPGEDSNSITIIVKHLWGNMMSRWTNFLTEDGEKPWRDRDGEFEADIHNREALMMKWAEGWACFINTLKELTNEDLEKTIYIRNEGHLVSDAIMRQMCHYASHIGQIMYIGKIIKGSSWVSLSIPKGQSTTYNQSKFDQDKSDRHFTDEV